MQKIQSLQELAFISSTVSREKYSSLCGKMDEAEKGIDFMADGDGMLSQCRLDVWLAS